MTDEEMAKDYAEHNQGKYTNKFGNLYQAYLAGLEYNNKQIAELKEKISVLLSCKNCSENKGGWICAKEYENKCLSQKIMYIKELKKENAELKKTVIKMNNVITEIFSKLTEAKEIIKKLYSHVFQGMGFMEINDYNVQKAEAEQFISEVEK